MKRVSLFFAFVFFGILSYGQSAGDITLAPQVGLNISSFNYETSGVDYESKTGFTGGVIGEYYFNDTWSFRSGLVYDVLGAENELGGVNSFDYLHVPLNANWHFGSDKNWYLNFGPAVGFLLDATFDPEDGPEEDATEAFKNIDFGLSIGIGYKFEVNESLMLFVDFQGYNGLIDIIDIDDEDIDVELSNIRTAFNVGAIFKL
jgi:hypothetical protein